ncbi:MAG: sugar ABC transporter ATP-binding protein [Planctomycetes bacterium]|nr:sugar ABC transporter ATP-binding protein [Planctomycetota bacterium]
MSGVQKRFGGVVALGGVDLEVRRGEVHALLGENGAGKSTLMKVLSGAHAPDAGECSLDGAPYAPSGPQDALERGVAMIYQELNLAPELTVAQNVLLGREPRGALGWIQADEVQARVASALEALGAEELQPDTLVRDLGPGQRQLVEIARALVEDAQLIVLDEPTSSLSQGDTRRLFEVVKRLTGEGVAVIYISHFLEEVQEIGDRFTVLRDGETVGAGVVRETSLEELVALMAGRSLDEFFPKVPHEPGEVILELEALAGEPLPREASLSLRRGEVLGIAGLVGAGRTELLRALFALEPVRSGEVKLNGAVSPARSPRERLDEGVGLLSEDRKGEGLALDLDLATNATLSHMTPFSRGGWIQPSERRAAVERWIERLGIRCTGPEQRAGDLSGGNQQKAALARLLHHDVDVLLLDEPTRGVDVGAKVEVYRVIGELAAAGKAVLVVSSYLPELFGICDRIAVMHRGVLGPARPVDERTEEEVMSEATRGFKEEVA